MRRPDGMPWRAAALALGLVLVTGSWTPAVVNPGFTPKHLEEQSDLIFTFKVAAIDADGRGATLTVGEVLKGKLAAARVRMDLKALLAVKDGQVHADAFLELLKSAQDRPGVIAAGKSATDAKVLAYLHLEGRWVQLSQLQGPEAWAVETVAPQQGAFSMDATFNGGSDMLIATLRFIRRFPGAGIMRVEPGAGWVEHARLGRLPGKANALLAADVNGDGRLDLFATCPDGDRVFLQGEKGKFTEMAGAPGSASAAAAWADFDGDGRPDLASLGKYGLNVWLQKGPGKFTETNVRVASEVQLFETGSPTMNILDIEPDGRPDLVVGLNRPVVLRNDGKAGFTAVALPAEAKTSDRGPAGPCVVADFNADGLTDIVQTFEKGGLLWRGKPGGFHEPAECGALAGKAPWRRAALADLDGDGLLDILLIGGGTTTHLLQNQGGRRFAEAFRFCGEPNYKIQTGATCAAFGDFNNDTFVDLFVGGEGEERLFFYNRGFRSLAVDERQALKIEDEAMPGVEAGAVAAVWADFGASGALSLALALPNGDVCLSRTDLAAQPRARALRVPFDQAAKSAAPQLVRFYLEGRCLGARLAERWGGPAVLGVEAAATYTAVWKTPEGKELSREMEAGEDASSAAPPKVAGQPKGPAPPPAGAPPAERSPVSPRLVIVLAGIAVLALVAVVVVVMARRKRGAGS